MVDGAHFSESYYRDRLRAYVHCTPAGCGVDVAELKPVACPSYRLELLLQPTDERGWPQGRARCLYEAEVLLTSDRWSGFARGHQRLPFRLSEDLLRRCHLRLTCRTLVDGGATTQDPGS